MTKYAIVIPFLLFSCAPDESYLRDSLNNNQVQNVSYTSEENIEPYEDKITDNIQDNQEKNSLKPLNVPWQKNPGILIKGLTREQLIHTMLRAGFKDLDKWETGILKRIWLAYNYDQFFWDMHELTGFPVSIIYSYFIIEATIGGAESKLMREHMNPGGVKYHGRSKKTKAYDDCYNSKGKPIPCDFSSFDTYEEMVEGWSRVFNQKRYSRCKSYDNAPDICRCLYKSGYHTANNWRDRAQLSKDYWSLRASMPRRD